MVTSGRSPRAQQAEGDQSRSPESSPRRFLYNDRKTGESGVAEGRRAKRMVLGTPEPGSLGKQRRTRPQVKVRLIIACLGREWAPITSPDCKKSDLLLSEP